MHLSHSRFFVTPAIVSGQSLPDESKEKNERFREDIQQIENQIRSRGDNPRELPVGYKFVFDGDTMTLADGSNPWSTLHSQPEYYGRYYGRQKQVTQADTDKQHVSGDTAESSTPTTYSAAESEKKPEGGFPLWPGILMASGIVAIIL